MTDEIGNAFPRSLLTRHWRARLLYFKQYTVAHPLQQTAHDEVFRFIREPGTTSVLLVMGPTGVGKSTLLEKVRNQINHEHLHLFEADPGRGPAFSVEAVNPESNIFRWGEFYKRALVALDEQMVEHKVAVADHAMADVRHITSRRSRTEDWREALEKCLLNRKPSAWLVDEGQHIAKGCRGDKIKDQLDCIKSLANMSNTLIILFGTYDLIHFRNLNDQLSRRCKTVHFPRYRAECKSDVRNFKRVLQSFERHLPLEQAPSLVPDWEYYYERSVGCIGILKDWLTNALLDVLEEEAKAREKLEKGELKALGEDIGILTKTHIEHHALPMDAVLNIAETAVAGERELASKNGKRQRDQLRLLLKMKPKPKAVTAHDGRRELPIQDQQQDITTQHEQQRERQGLQVGKIHAHAVRPFHRKANRDKVGE